MWLYSVCTFADNDECKSAHQCVSNSKCFNNEGSYICQCLDGYTGDGRARCSNIDECSLGSHGCSTNASCADIAGSYTCTCGNGLSGSGRGENGCYNIDECVLGSHTCPANGKCVDNFGSYECQCRKGYMENGTECVNINECLSMSHFCRNNTDCVDNDGSFRCQCHRGYAGNNLCRDVNECLTVTHSCDQNARCLKHPRFISLPMWARFCRQWNFVWKCQWVFGHGRLSRRRKLFRYDGIFCLHVQTRLFWEHFFLWRYGLNRFLFFVRRSEERRENGKGERQADRVDSFKRPSMHRRQFSAICL